MHWIRLLLLVLPVLAVCGSVSGVSAAAPRTTTMQAQARAAASTTPARSPLPPLQAEAAQAAAGDIPDNQVFVTYAGPGYTIKVPEGWAQNGHGNSVTFRDKNNIIRIVIRPAHHASGKTTYRTTSAPNPVTGKRVTLAVERHYKPKGGKTAIIDLGGPVGVDNVDAYTLIANSFRWR